MAVTNTHLVLARKFLIALTWTRIFKIFVVALIAIVLVLAWYSRTDFIKRKKPDNGLSVITLIEVPPYIRNEIDSVVRKSEMIIGVRVITINFQKNIRTDSYVSIDDPLVMEVYTRYINNKVYETPLFSGDKVSNKRLLRLISGEFICTPYSESLTYDSAPVLDKRIKAVCSTAIPPYNGDFSGIFSVYTSTTPDKDDIDRLFLLSRDISLKIYEENKHGRNNK